MNPALVAPIAGVLLKPFTAAGGAARNYAESEVVFTRATRYFSLVLAVGALLLAVMFMFYLPTGLTLGDGLTFVGLLFTAASFFANASSGGSNAPGP
jgi:hypothetical protein